MVIGQAAQGVILVAVAYLYRNIEKIAKDQNARMKMGTQSGNDI